MGGIIFTMNLHEIERLSYNPKNLQWAKDHYEDIDLLADYQIHRLNKQYEIMAIYKNYGYQSQCRIIIEDDKVTKTLCSCQFHHRHDACGHVIAALYFYLDLYPLDETFNFQQFKQSYQYHKQQQEILSHQQYEQHLREYRKTMMQDLTEKLKQQTLHQFDIILHQQQYQIKLEITEEHQYNYQSRQFKKLLTIALRVGDQRFYVVKNLKNFLEAIEEQMYVKYGAKLAFTHDLQVFDQPSQMIVNALQDLIRKAEYQPNYRYLVISENNYDNLYELLSKIPEEYYDIQLVKEPFECELTVAKIDDTTYHLEVKDDFDYQISKQYFYSFDGHFLTQYWLEHPQITPLIKQVLMDDAYVDEATLITIIRLLRQHQSITITGDIPQFNNVEQLALYLDVQQDAIRILYQVIFENGAVINGLMPQNHHQLNYEAMKVYEQLTWLNHTIQQDYLYLSLLEEETFRFLEYGLLELQKYCVIYASDSLKNINRPTALSVQVGVTMKHGLLAVDVKSLDVSNTELSQLLMMYRRRKKYHRLKNGDVINLQSEDMKQLDQLVNDLQLNVKSLDQTQNVPLFRSFQVVDQNTFKQLNLDIDADVVTFTNQIKAIKDDDIVINPTFNQILKPYQQAGVKWLLMLEKVGLHGLLADDMGLGKTLQIIAMLESKQRNEPSIVICPASLMFNWEAELKKFNSQLSYCCIYGNKSQRQTLIQDISKYQLIITTYDYLKADIDLYEKQSFSVVIIDEAQYIKNQNTKAAVSVKTLKANFKVALSGTPIENRLSELWSIFDFLMPGYLYHYHYFKQHFEKPIILDEDKATTKRLRQLTEPFILRRTKQEVLQDLPEKTEKILSFTFSEQEQKLYTAKLAEGNREVMKILGMKQPDKLQILRILNELRQLCCDPRLIYENYQGISSKIQGCLEVVASILNRGEKVLIFSSYTSVLDLLEIEMKKRLIHYYKLTGQTSKEKRKDLVASFQHDDSQVFLMSLKAAGVGLNLTAAQNVIHFDPWWNVSAENQATDRTYRIGQTNDVQVFKLIMKDSIEEKIIDMQQRKKQLSDLFIEGSSGGLASLSSEEIIDLFK